MSDKLTAKCFCGAVELELSGDPAAMGYCHCSDCAEWAAAPINAFSLWQPDSVKVTKGEDNIGTFNRTENSDRKFCKTCGGHIMAGHPGMGLIDVYASIIPGLVHEPALHVWYGEKTVSVKDGLPKFKDMPSDLGGSGDTLPE